jgi:ATP-binding cassette subfamily F protein uup
VSAPQAKQAPKTTAAALAEKPVEALSFTQRHRLEALPAEIDRLNAEIVKLEAYLAQPDLYTTEPVKFAKATAGLVERQKLLAQAEEEWLELAERAEG